MRTGTLLRLALAGGRADGLRVVLTGLGASLGTLALLAAATVLSIRGDQSNRYTNNLLFEPGLRPGVAATILLLCLPILFFAGQCTRVGAPARDRRLAAIRLTGGTPRGVALIAAAETAVAATAGALVGALTFLAGRVLLDNPDEHGLRPLPTDVLPAWPLVAMLVIAVPVFAGVFTVVALRRVIVSPFGVVRRRRTQPPRVAAAVLLLGGFTGLAVSGTILRAVPADLFDVVVPLLVITFAVTTGVGLLMGMAPLASSLGRLIAPRAGRPALLIAARRLVADPWAGSRSLAALVMTVFVGATIIGVRVNMLTELELSYRVNNQIAQAIGEVDQSGPDPFYSRAYELLDLAVWVAAVIAAAGLLVATAEQITARRRTLAALSAAGTPTGVLVRAALLEIAIPLAVGVFISSMSALIAVRSVFSNTVAAEQSGSECETCAVIRIALHADVPVPWGDLLALSGGAVAIALLFTGAGLAFLRRASAVRELRAG